MPSFSRNVTTVFPESGFVIFLNDFKSAISNFIAFGTATDFISTASGMKYLNDL